MNCTSTKKAKAAPKRKPRTIFLPQYDVILLNDDVNFAVDILAKVIEIMHFPTEDAIPIVREAHKKGRALLITTHKERAELIQGQFKSCKIDVDIEPV